MKGLLVRFASGRHPVRGGAGVPGVQGIRRRRRFASAGFAILDAALLRTVEAFREHREAEASRRDRRLKDLDETTPPHVQIGVACPN